jgi:hypothetical protein
MQISPLTDGAPVSWWVVVVISVPITVIIVILLAIRLNKFCWLKKIEISGWKVRPKSLRNALVKLLKRSKRREIEEEHEHQVV